MKAVHFGAGNIGRGFIGLLLVENGYEVTFIDVDERKIDLLNSNPRYPVIIVGEDETTKEVEGYKGLWANNQEEVIKAIAEANIITTAVGKESLQKVAPLIAEGLLKKLQLSKISSEPIHIIVIACENVNDNTSYLKSLILPYIAPEEWNEIENLVSFPNCVVDRIIPNISPDELIHPLAVAVEEYALFVIDKKVLGNKILNLQGAEFTENIKGALEQKLFTLNMAHAIVGYYGYLAGFQYVHEALEDTRVQTLLNGAMAEISQLLELKHGISEAEQQNYVQKTLKRLKNPKLSDEIVRVARQPKRKLHPTDRLIAPAQGALEAGITPAYLATGIAGALAYDYIEDEQAKELVRDLRQKGIDAVLRETALLNPNETLARMVKSDFTFQELTRRR
ncbi:MAG: hypothetical protein A3G49_03410 [Candidatus Sungbacteria bacterium RIFCSPLOWO2_12_FULL_41_11]|uniref:Mannitol-1-phosphate 5-dehydrogenase n=1 Tax=Candidatus Sungbacteria bacterium RIFCSPLOWO2_12_FULL_41_11 TaxID=1802286 RepID=A0A1G2LT73_9BACT|nr:MAG: Mannitol-1-phosphate 5-dehydrogenase [Parcubacteria group bacterium GW2011_GWA2_42_14]OGZ98288.1 MAG: hypothetical protein A3D41_04095 [Candidatus Sungbacteria bacterium RIFCSPHIGHO2_02_FULL_41_12b]OHA14753.1 MAG: hypothetical protein A3G49_03410 [Candidatus Sungbacteria bacterium RIFCSPLOWO2_12_FULL_41_11]